MITPRSPIVSLGVGVAAPPAVLVALYLFFAGHNQPGGGFAAGLVLGALVALRAIAGKRAPASSTTLLWVGAALAAGVAVLPAAFDDAVLDQRVVDVTIPLLGKVKSGTALVFDAGVATIVVGLVMAVLDGLGISRIVDPSPETETAVKEEGGS